LFEEVQTAMKASDDAARTAESQGKPADREVVAHSREVRLVRNGRRSTYQALATRTQQGGVLIVLRDISTLAGAVQMKTDFVANASHELRTPIAAIKVAFETLAECIDDDPVQANRCMTIIAGHLRRFEEMLRDLLDLSRVESPDLRPMLSPLPANDVILALQSLWQHAADEKGVELRFKLDDPDLVFQSDKRLLDLILRNLIENALKFTPAGGHVTVEIARHALPPDAARAHEQLTGEGFSEVIVTVTDSGIGIPAEHLDRVFERFYQVDAARTGTNAGRGTGLGLAIVKHAALALGGSIKLASTMGKGTTATCVLPQIGEPAEPMPQLAAHE
jgi:signal transduction histidine kinase